MVYKYLGLEKPNEEDEQLNDAETLEVCTDLMPTDLEAISPDSVASVRNVFNTDIGEFSPKLSENDDAYMKDAKNDEYESPPFEPINDKDQFISENSNESRLSGISGLTSRGSLTPKVNDTEVENNDQDSHLSRISSNSQSSVIVSSNIVVNTSEDHTIKSNVQSTDESTKNDDMEDNNKLNVELKMDVESSMSCDSDAKALVIITESSNDTVEDKNVDQTNGNNKGKVENYTDKQMKNEVSKTSSESKSDKYKSHSSKKRISSSHSSHSDKHHSSSSSHHHKSKHRHHDKSDDKKERSDHDRDKYKKYKKSYKDSKDEKSHKDKEKDREKVRDREREKEKDREREKERSRSTKSDHSKDRKDKHDSHSKHNSSEKHREGKSRSPHRDSSKSKSSSSGHSKSSRKHSDSTSEHGTKDNKVEKDGSKDYKVEKDGSKDYKVEKDKVRKKSRSQDDHSSAKNSKSSFRRSTDRDSNDGHGGGLKKHNISSHSVPSSNNNKETTSDTLQNDSKTVENTNPKTKDISSNVEVQNSKSLQKEDRKPSPVTERRKPKIASNIYEARKLIKVRRKIERQNQKEKLRHLKTQEAAQENSDLELTQYECDDDSSSNTKDNTAEKAKDTLPKEDAISKKTLKRDDNISKKGLSLESKNSNSGSPQFFGFAQNHRVYYDLDADEMDVVHNLSSSSHEFEDPQQKSKAEIMEIILGHDICIANQNGNADGPMRNGFFKVSYCSDYDDDEESMDIDNSPTSNCVNNNVHKKQKLDEDSDKSMLKINCNLLILLKKVLCLIHLFFFSKYIV